MKWFLLISAVVVIWLYMINGTGGDSNSSILPIGKTTIAKNELEIQEDGYKYYKFTISSTETIKLNIKNLTSNGFEVFIFDEDNFDSYKDMNSCSAISVTIPGGYESDKDFTMSSGTYYLVFSKTHCIL